MNEDTGEITVLTPEYNKMSSNPGIGYTWLLKFMEDIYSYDHCIINGRATKAPRYYDRKLKHIDPQRLETIKENRIIKAKEIPTIEKTEKRRKVRERVMNKDIQRKQRVKI